MRMRDQLVVEPSHLRLLHNSLLLGGACGWTLESQGLERGDREERDGNKWSSLEGVMRDKDVTHVVDTVNAGGERTFGTTNRRQTTIRRAIQELREVLCKENRCRDARRGDNELGAEGHARGWRLVVLVGTVERSAQGVLWNERNQRAQVGYQLITKLWRRVGVRAVAQVHDLPSPSNDGVPDVLFDRLLEALLWRLPRPPGPGIRGGPIRAALGEHLGSRPAMREAEKTVTEVVAGWKRCCELAQAWKRHGGPLEPAVKNRTLRGRRKADGRNSPAKEGKTGDTGGVPRTPDDGARTSALLAGSNEGIRGASDKGIFQALRAIRRQMKVGAAGLEWKSLRKALNSLLSRSAQEILRQRREWDRTRGTLL